MGIALRQSTASQEIVLGYFLDSTDGNTEETALTIANTDIKIWKNGAVTLSNKTSGGATHISNGIYYATLDATDTDTVGPMIIFCHVAGALSVRLECHVYEEAIFDALFGSGAAAFDGSQRVDVGKWLGTAVTTSATTAKPEVDAFSISNDATAANNAELAFDGTGFGFTACTIPTVTTLTNAPSDSSGVTTLLGRVPDTISQANIADAVWDELSTGHTTAGKAGEQLWTDLDTVLVDTAALNDTKIPDTLSLANINAEVDTALNTAIPGTPTSDSINERIKSIDDLTQASGAGDLAAILTDTGTTLNTQLTDMKGATFNSSTDSLEAIRDKETDIETDTQDIQTRLPAALVTGRMNSDIKAVDGSTDAATSLEKSAAVIIRGSAVTGTLSTTQMTTDLTEATDDHYNGRTIIWTSGVNLGQQTDITDYTGATKLLTYTATTEAPSNADTFVIV